MHIRPARLFDDFARSPLERSREAAAIRGVDPEARQMSPRYIRWLHTKAAHGLPWPEWKARDDAQIKEAADRAERKSAGVPPSHEPSHIDLAEMHVAGLISQITDFCRAARLARENPDAIKAAWNHGAFTQGVPLKMISWPQWGRQ